MGLFRCLKSKATTNYITGSDLGTSTTTIWTLVNTPVVPGSLTGTIVRQGTSIQTFGVDITGAFTFHDIGTPSVKATAGTFNPGLGKVTLTWNQTPGTNSGIVSYTGLPVYKYLTMLNFGVSCPPPYNPLCNTHSKAWVAAVTVCDQALYG